MTTNIVLIGTGSLARAFCYSIANAKFLVKKRIKVVIVGRDIEKVKKISVIANSRAAITSTDILFIPKEASFDSEASIENIITKFTPKIVLQMASLQSPWEFNNQKSTWVSLINNSGFALTIPFQAFLTIKLARIIKKTGLSIHFVNACYPDLVNPILKFLGYNVTCGVGNVSIIESVIRSVKNSYRKMNISILGHHVHLTQKTNIPLEYRKPRVWGDDINYDLVDLALNQIRSIKDDELNQLTGLISAQTILNLLKPEYTLYNIPGPNGLPGGYPVLMSSQGVILNLPNKISEEEAVLWNLECSKYDGASIDKDGFIKFNRLVSGALKQNNIKHFKGFYCEDIDNVCNDFISLREHLREE